MIRTIHINDFKSIVEQPIELGRVNCLIGANGSGKSNILEAIGVLSAAANGRVDDESLMRRGVRVGTPSLFKSSFETAKTSPQITLSATGDTHEEYSVSLLNPLENPNPAWNFKTELLSNGVEKIFSRGMRSPDMNLQKDRGLAALKIIDLAATNPAAQLIQQLQNYAIYSPNTPAMRGIVTDPQSRDPIGLAGGRLAEGFADLRKNLLDKNEDLLDSVFELIDWVAEIETSHPSSAILSSSVPSTKYVLKFTDRFMRKNRNTLTAYDASEGALYVLFCALLCLAPNAPKIFAIDNLDQALNPKLVARLTSKLATWLTVADPQRQLLFTAHNPAVLDGLDLTDDEVRLFAVERNNKGYTEVRRIKPSNELLALNENYPLSRLWLMGRLGAIPNV
ncbi:MAG: AAA family ATPase [Moraxellaceae bacterium]|nr:AAA family ATPase [Pseudomonadales bacterium]MCB1673224.1 AAA family ATPase [Pseudomonadales bacterium]MCP5174127.1 AAA family ATPase [Moraxellaceae bacterium]MCP5176286.1 AAA family ATPase [Moraxellaceae bacterium]HQV21743.1 AAA family ATPase [Agitococcus sp.]